MFKRKLKKLALSSAPCRVNSIREDNTSDEELVDSDNFNFENYCAKNTIDNTDSSDSESNNHLNLKKGDIDLKSIFEKVDYPKFEMNGQQNPSVQGVPPQANPPSGKAQINQEDSISRTCNQIFNSLRIPDAIKDLPTYDGNPRSLYDFICNIEEILSLIPSVNGTSYSKIILRAIRNKVVGDANDVLNMYGTPTSWDDIKNNLIVHYSDKRNETNLIRDLHLLRQGSDTIEKFYAKIIEILSTMTNHINVHENDQNVIQAKQSLHKEMCLNTFLSGLREPLGSTIRAMRPSSLTDAFSFCPSDTSKTGRHT